MVFSNPEPVARLTRRSLLITAASAALLAVPATQHSRTLARSPLATPATVTGVFFDPSVVHDIAATFDQADYDAMIAAYKETGDKEWLKATLTIDGRTFDDVGLRLKGNSSLMGLRDRGAQDMGDPNGAQPGPAPLEGTPAAGAENGQTGATFTMTAAGGPSNISADEPQGLPWLVRLDKYVDGQHFDGLSEFVIRSNNSETALNEALALDLLAAAGLASQAAAYLRFSVDDSDPVLRIAIENPDDSWLAEHFTDPGTLFKSEADGNWSYKDDDLDAYKQSFDLEAGGSDDDATDYAPLISFLDFVNNSDDATFASELPRRLDVDAFAVYLAMMDLIQNTDDISGPGNNSYLFYDDTTGIMTVVPWDMNLAFGGMGGMGGGRGFPGGQMPNGGQFPLGLTNTEGTPIAGPGGAPTFPGAGNGGGAGFGGGNPLVQRWNEVDAFTTLQTDTRAQLVTTLFASDTATGILARWTDLLETQATDLIDRSTIDSESQRLQEQIDAA